MVIADVFAVAVFGVGCLTTNQGLRVRGFGTVHRDSEGVDRVVDNG